MEVTPSALVQRHFNSLLDSLDGALDGDVESVHQTRVATRRLREVLHLVDGDSRHVMGAVKSAGRHLGRVRDLDVLSSLLDSLGSRIPTTAAVDVHRVTHAVRTRRHEARRKMVKGLEQLDLPALRDVVTKRALRGDRWWAPRLRSERAEWTTRMWDRINERSRIAVAAVARTRAIYLPNRVHHARIAIKRFRYALEVVADAGLWQAEAALKELRRLQSLLGDVHDLQVLGETFAELTPKEQMAATEASPIRALLEDELARHYADYAKRRDRVFLIAEACRRAAKRQGSWRIPVPLVAATVVAAPVFIESLRSLRRTPQSSPVQQTSHAPA